MALSLRAARSARLASLIGLLLAAPGCADIWGFKDLSAQADASTSGESGASSDASVEAGPTDGAALAADACDATNTIENCGACGAACAPVNDDNLIVTCDGTNCQYVCAAGRRDCTTTVPDTVGCVPTNTNEHCGGCGGCDTTHSPSGYCSNGTTCVYPTCSPGYIDCNQTPPDNDGCESEIPDGASACALCGQAGCSTAHIASVTDVKCVADGGATPYCTYGACAANYADCNTSPPDLHGCDTDLRTAANCGGCGKACDTQNSTGASCVNSACQYTGCDSAWMDCDAGPPDLDGCETPRASVRSCGGCNTVCDTTTGTPSCDGTTCSYRCAPNRIDCNKGTAPDVDGCECIGNGCCPSSPNGCQYVHANTLGMIEYTFDNCNPLKSYGSGDAQQACEAAGASSCAISNTCCAALSGLGVCLGNRAYSVCGMIGNSCYCWQYDGGKGNNDRLGTVQITSITSCSATCSAGNSLNVAWQ